MTTQLDPGLLRRCWFLAGPTASGKSDLALVLAERIGAEIVAMDSMTVYRRMDLGTAKPSSEDLRRVPHHLLDIIEPHEEYSVAEYVAAAVEVCESIDKRAARPLFVGGTGLFLRGLLRGVFSGPPADREFRERLEREASQHEGDWLWDRVQRVDPDCAQRLHPHDTRRLVRALEVFELTGRPLSQQQQQQSLPDSERPPHVFWLSPPRDWLYDRINRRVLSMVASGLVEEVQRLLSADPPPGRTARQALGYKEIIDHLEGDQTLEEAVDTIQRHTRRLARKQTTWFRNLSECQEVTISGAETVEELADRLDQGRE